MKKVLIVVTNHSTLGETDQENGTYSPEITHVVSVLNKNNVDYDIASIKGGKAPLYGTDIEGDEENAKVLGDDAFRNRINNTLPIANLSIEDYAGIFYPGGFGLLSDLAHDQSMGALASRVYDSGGILSAVCHGPAGFLPIKLSSGESLLSTVSVTGFTREEEIDFGTINDIPFLLEERLSRSAQQYTKKQPWQPLVITDNRVITGQNPASARGVGEALVAALND